MIKLTKISSPLEDAPTILIIPGGPGLSSLTLRDLNPLNKSFNLVYLDLPGTNQNPYKKRSNFKTLVKDILNEVKNIKTAHCIGHSYGGYFALEVANNLNLESLTCIGTPFSEEALKAINKNYHVNMSPKLKEVETEWLSLKNDSSFLKWLSEYDKLYFTNPLGKNLILNDPASSRLFLDNRNEVINKEKILNELQFKKTKKTFIMGKNDLLLDREQSKDDAEKFKFQFIEIANAGHFTSFDQPITTVGVIAYILKN